jgi:predicted amidophosphoribosyltransferase
MIENKIRNMSDSKVILCDKCGTEMQQNHCEGSFGINANLFRCPKCNYQYEIGFRYNPFINQFVKYYKFI